MTQEEAINLAHEECMRQSLSWGEPIYVKEGLFSFTVTTYSNRRPPGAYIKIRKNDAKIVSVICLPR